MEQKKLKKHKLIASFIGCILFISVWYVICLIYSIAYSEGILSIFKDAFGMWIVYIGVILALFSFLSIFYLRIWIKKEWKIQLISYGITFIFLFTSMFFFKIANGHFKEFTTEKWIQYPEQRITMYFDLERKYDLHGYSQKEVEAILGTPDEILEDRTYVYTDGYENSVFVFFKDERVTDYRYVE